MNEIVDDERRKQFGLGAAMLGGAYDMGGLTEQYIAHYEAVAHTFALRAASPSTERAGTEAFAAR